MIVSSAAKTQLQELKKRELRRRERQRKATGVFNLKPDYDHFMKPVEKGKRDDPGILPTSDFDLEPYRKKWKATEDSCDLGNEETCKNRYMLIGRPQIGKTGVFLTISYLLWQKVGSPEFTGPEMEKPSKILVENCDEEEDEDETEANTIILGVPGKRRLFLNPYFAGKYPDFRHIRSRSLLKPNLSKRYGDPNDKDTQDWYANGKTYPPLPFLKGNSLLKRRHPDQSGSPRKHMQPDSPKRTGNLSGRPHIPRLKAVEVSQNRFSAKRITPVEQISDTELGSRVRSCFSKHSIDHWGTLYTQKSEEAGKWIVTRDTSTSPTVAQLRLQ